MNPYWSYALTLIGAVGLLLAGRMNRAGWAIGFSAQGLWAAYAVTTHQYGFLISAFIYSFVYGRNFWAWNQATHQRNETPS